MARRYEMSSRTEAMQRTREAILDSAFEQFTDAWFDEVTLADVARHAGVSQQTVVNHFGSKMGLFLTGLAERFVPALEAVRDAAVPGDVGSVVGIVVADYEQTGDGTVRLQALAPRVDELRTAVVEPGRAYHRRFVEHVFSPQLRQLRGARRERLARLLVCALDVSMWHQLRRVEGLDADATRAHLTALVEGLLTAHGTT